MQLIGVNESLITLYSVGIGNGTGARMISGRRKSYQTAMEIWYEWIVLASTVWARPNSGQE